MPLAKTLIKNGISDMVLSVTSCIKGTPIDWENWRKKKLIDYSEALLLAGPEGIREAIDIGGNAMKSIKKEGFVSFISQLGDVSQKQLQIIGSSLTNDQKQSIENSNQTLQDVSKIACLNLNYQELQQMASEIIQDQVIYGTISQETGNEINELLTQSVNQVQQTNGSLKDAFVSFGAKYLKAQIGKKKVEQLNEENQEETIQKIKSDCQTKYNAVKDQIDNFQEYKERLTNELNQFSKILWNCFQSDIEIQKQIIIIDLFFEIICDFQKVQNQVNDTKLQEMIRQNFSIHNKTFQQQCCQNLQISNKQQMVQFYNERINPIIKRIVHHFLSQIKFTEPLEIVIRNQINEQMTNLSTQLNQQKNNLEGQQKQIEQFDKIINNHGTQQQYDQFNQMVNAFNQQHQQYTQIIQQSKEINQQRMYEIANQLIQHLVQKQMIVGNGLSVKDSGMEEFNQFSASRIPNPLIKNLIGLALQDSIQNGLSKYQCGKRFFSNLLKSTIQLQVLDEIKSYIFKQRLQQVEQSVMKEFD